MAVQYLTSTATPFDRVAYVVNCLMLQTEYDVHVIQSEVEIGNDHTVSETRKLHPQVTTYRRFSDPSFPRSYYDFSCHFLCSLCGIFENYTTPQVKFFREE